VAATVRAMTGRLWLTAAHHTDCCASPRYRARRSCQRPIGAKVCATATSFRNCARPCGALPSRSHVLKPPLSGMDRHATPACPPGAAGLEAPAVQLSAQKWTTLPTWTGMLTLCGQRIVLAPQSRAQGGLRQASAVVHRPGLTIHGSRWRPLMDKSATEVAAIDMELDQRAPWR
jgi:hypothetical protein